MRNVLQSVLLIAVISTRMERVGWAGCPCSGTDLQTRIDRAAEKGEKRIVFPPGRYRAAPQGGQPLVLSGLTNVQIIADGVELVCAENARALTVSRCSEVTLRGLVIDYDPLPFTEGRIVALLADQGGYDVELFDGYPDADKACAFKFEVFDPETRRLRCVDQPVARVEAIDARHLRVIRGGAKGDGLPERLGDVVVTGVNYPPWGVIAKDVDRYSFQHHAVVCEESSHIRFANMALYASYWFGFFEYRCDGNVYQNCRADRRPGEADPVKRAYPRLRSLNADAFHSVRAAEGPAYIGCTAKFMGDDAVNIHGDYHLISDCLKTTLRILVRDRMNIRPGDSVELFSYDGRRLPDGCVVRVERDGGITDGERAFLREQRIRGCYRTNWDPEAWNVTLRDAVDLPRGSVMVSLRETGRGFLVQGCEFGPNRSRGVLIRASHGKIVGNRFNWNSASSVLLSSECFWLEGGNPDDVEVSGNTIADCGDTAIRVDGTGGLLGKPGAPAGLHRRLTIRDNVMIGGRQPAVSAGSTDGLVLTGNRFYAAEASGGTAFAVGRMIETENCRSVVQTNNVLCNQK